MFHAALIYFPARRTAGEEGPHRLPTGRFRFRNVFILLDKIHGQRFWPSVETWGATKTRTVRGLGPAGQPSLRAHFYGTLSMEGKDTYIKEFILETWGNVPAYEAINMLSKEKILVTYETYKEISFEVGETMAAIMQKGLSSVNEDDKFVAPV